MAQDPVCKMQVDEKKATVVAVHMGERYYFCSDGCKKAFEREPHKYLKQ